LNERLVADLEEYLRELQVDLYGFANIAEVFGGRWRDWPYAISIALELPIEDMLDVQDGPTPRYYAAYVRTNDRLNQVGAAVESWIRQQGYRAQAVLATVSSEGLDKEFGPSLTASVQHKTVATRAGLGWIGKNALLITQKYGPRVRLTSVFTDMPLPAAMPIEYGQCGKCTRCQTACPAQAISGDMWVIGVSREALVDVEACRLRAEQLLMERVGEQNAVCGVCVAVCPFAGRPSGKATTSAGA